MCRNIGTSILPIFSLQKMCNNSKDNSSDNQNILTVQKKTLGFFFHSRNVRIDIIKVFYLPTDAQ